MNDLGFEKGVTQLEVIAKSKHYNKAFSL